MLKTFKVFYFLEVINMGSMYKMIFGENRFAEAILAMLGLKKEDIGRFRDAFITGDKIAIYTRLGGYYNRESYAEYIKKLQEHPHYLYDEDDEIDSTYATFYFSIPEEFKEVAKKLDTGEFDPDERWREAMEELSRMSLEEIEKRFSELLKVLNALLEDS